MLDRILDILNNLTVLETLEILGTSITTYAVFKFLRLVLPPYWSPHRRLRGPKSTGFLLGNVKELIGADDQVALQEQWYAEYGHVYKYKAFLNSDRIWTNDLKAIQHILGHSMVYEKPDFIRNTLGHIAGEGLLFAEGHEHKLQRRVMSPAFTVSHLREMTDIFVSKSAELRDSWLELIQTSPKSGEATVEVMEWLGRATLDIIGLAGFNYRFDALKAGEEASELSAAFAETFKSGTGISFLGIVQNWVPLLNKISFDKRTRTIVNNKRVMQRIGLQLIHEKQEAVRKDIEAGLEKGPKAKDLLSLLIRSNMSPDVLPSQRLTEDQVLHQIPTFIVAGHETTSTSTTWALYALARHPEVQTKLRAELQSFPHDSPSMDELNSLTYLDAVIKETMRLYAPVENTGRVAHQNDVVPLEKPFFDKDGVIHHEIVMRKGDSILVPILAVNRSKEIWGPDADQFIPERWFEESPNSVPVPGVWSNMLSFLGGAHACIGFKFAITEMKALLFQLIRSLEFESEIPMEAIGKKVMVVSRPYVKDQKEMGNRLSMIIRPATMA